MSMQRLLEEGHSGDELQESQGVYYHESQPSSAPLPSFSQHVAHVATSHVLNLHTYAPMFSSSSPVFFRMPPVTPPNPRGFQVPFSSMCNQSEQTTPVAGQGVVSATRSKGRKLSVSLSQQVDGGGITKPATKTTKRKGTRALNTEANEDEDNETSCSHWKDPWVVSLIHKWGSLHEEFNKPQKQGVDLWSKIANRLASMHSDFNLSSEGCRKKWGRVYDLYKVDQLHNSISGNDFQQTCKWYGIVDEYMHNRAHVRVYSHASAAVEFPQEEETPSPPIIGSEAKELKTKQVRGGRKDAQMEQFIAHVTENGKGILAHLEKVATSKEVAEVKRDATKSKRLETLQTLSSTFVRLVDQACQK